MRLGYTQPLYLLPFDDCDTYITETLQLGPPLTSVPRRVVVDCQELIYDGFRQALGNTVPAGAGGIAVNDELGTTMLRDAGMNGHATVLSVERSGTSEFELAHGTALASEIAAFRPTFVKARVCYNVEGDPERNQRQVVRLKQLADHCQSVGQRFMLELLVPPTTEQRNRAEAFGMTYDRLMHPALVTQGMRALQDAGIEPDVWSVDGLDRQKGYEHVAATARRDGRKGVHCIVSGGNVERDRVHRWLPLAASVPGFVGFAIGRATYNGAVRAYVAGQITRREAAEIVAQRYREWITIFERSRRSGLGAA